jgi:Phosphotransferase enzyme family
MREVRLVRTASELDADWLAGVLGAPVGSLSWEGIGTGQVGRTVRVRYGGGRSVVVKLASEDALSRATAVRIEAYRREVGFYRSFGGASVPACQGTAIDAAGEWFTIVLADLSGARVGDQFAGCSPAEAGATLDALAAVQAPTLGGVAPDWLAPRQVSTQALYQALLPAFLERFAGRLEPEHVELCRWFGPRVDGWAARRPGPIGLVHGDLRADNLLFAGSGCTIVDWQTVAWGPVLRDVSYLLGGSLPAGERRAHEQRLVGAYARALGAGEPWERTWWAYRHESLYGLLMSVVAAMIVGATERGDQMFVTMLGRHATHVLDLAATDLVPDPSPALAPAAADEERHEAGPEPLWNESYYLDCVSADGATGVYVRLGRLPHQGRTHASVAVAARGGPSVVLVDPDAPLPTTRPGGQRVEAAGFSVELAWPEPLASFQVSAAGTGVAHDDPAAHLRGEPGRPVRVALELTWHTDGVPYQWRAMTRYEIPCRVTGSLTVDGVTVRIDGVGQRDHSWGERDWWQLDWCWSALHLDDGTRWHSVSVPVAPGAGAGYRQRDGVITELTSVESVTTPTADHLFGTTTVRAEPGGYELRVTPVAFGPLRMDADDGRRSYFPRALCEVVAADGRTGVGWLEWNLVQRPG